MEQFWRQIRIQRAKIHKTSLVRSPAQGTFFCGPVLFAFYFHAISLFLTSQSVDRESSGTLAESFVSNTLKKLILTEFKKFKNSHTKKRIA